MTSGRPETAINRADLNKMDKTASIKGLKTTEKAKNRSEHSEKLDPLQHGMFWTAIRQKINSKCDMKVKVFKENELRAARKLITPQNGL